MKNKQTTFIEVILNQELGEPFRRDAMKAPVEVAGVGYEPLYDPKKPEAADIRQVLTAVRRYRGP